MADPLTITTGVVALLGTCITVATAIKGFYDGMAIVDVKVKGLLSDVESFTQVLRMVKDTLEDDKVKSSLQETGHIGNHWTNLSKSIQDGQNTLVQLQNTLYGVKKVSGFLMERERLCDSKGRWTKLQCSSSKSGRTAIPSSSLCRLLYCKFLNWACFWGQCHKQVESSSVQEVK
jgi:hypothetical protein